MTNKQLLEKFLAEANVIVEDYLGPGHENNLRQALKYSSQMRHGGNTWGNWCNYLSFVRDVVGWKHPIHEKYAPYEQACIHSGYRYMNNGFTIVSDRACEMHYYERNNNFVAHNEKGPSHKWSDGFAIYMIDGLELPDDIAEKAIMHPESLTLADIENDKYNNDIRAVLLDRFGPARYLQETGAKLIDEAKNEVENTHEALFVDKRGTKWLWPTCPSGRICPPLRLPAEIKTCEEARKWLQPPDHRFNIVART